MDIYSNLFLYYKILYKMYLKFTTVHVLKPSPVPSFPMASDFLDLNVP